MMSAYLQINQKSPLVSVLMSTFNEPLDWVKLAVKSSLNQTYTNIELVVVIDNPKRLDLIGYFHSLIQESSAVKLIVNKENIGLAQSLNKAFSISSGYYIARMDADDVMLPYRIEKQVDFLKNNGRISLVGSSTSIINEKGEQTSESLAYTGSKCMNALRFKSTVFHPTWLMKREVFIKNNGYSELPVSQDYDFLLKSFFNGFILDNITESLLYYRISAQNVSSKKSFLQAVTQAYIRNSYLKNKNGKIGFDYNDYKNYLKSQDKYKDGFDKYMNHYVSAKQLLRKGRISEAAVGFAKAFCGSKVLRSLIVRNIAVIFC